MHVEVTATFVDKDADAAPTAGCQREAAPWLLQQIL